MQQQTTKNDPKSTNIWSKIDDIMMKCVEMCQNVTKNHVFSDLDFSTKKTPEKRRFYGPGGWTWPSGETESAYLNHWIFSRKTKTHRDQHENIKRKPASGDTHFHVTFIISICRCLESFCFCYYLLSLDGTCCCCLWRFNVCYCLQPAPLPFAAVFWCLLLFCIIF